MPSPELIAADRRKQNDSDECIPLVEADADVAASLIAEWTSATEEQFQVECVTELASGVERLRK